MEKIRKTTVPENGLIWFGAGVSLAEILTGTYFASLGFTTGMLAIIVGHIIGCTLLFLAGLIGARTRRSSMGTAALSFGKGGAAFFAVLNILQLVGWTGIMIYDGALSANSIFDCGAWIWCLIIGALIIAWICIGIRNLGKVNVVAMAALFILTLVLCVSAFSGAAPLGVADDGLTFGAAVELAVSMPLSWLPLVSDYTRTAERPVAATATSAIVYGLVSCWMYDIGMAMAIFTGEYDIAQIMIKTGLGVAGLVIIVFSTVTTTFLDANSAGVSAEALGVPFQKNIPGKYVGIAAAVLGTLSAIIFPMDDITDFLYLIGSVFAPMIAIMIADFFLLKADHAQQMINLPNAVIWICGFALYRSFMNMDTPVGNTLPTLLIVMALCLIVSLIQKALAKEK